jgi:hypothetical protein
LDEHYQIIAPDSFEAENHWYPKALNATIHPMVSYFLNMSKERIVERYCHLHPGVERPFLHAILSMRPKHFRWAGADLINVTTRDGRRQMVIIENNSCPSGQKSMPLLDDHDEYGGYRKLIEKTFLPSMKGQRLAKGVMAVLYDKNPMEAKGYAATLAEVLQEDVYYIYFPSDGYESYLRFEDGVLQLKTKEGKWINISAAFRYVTQKPWNRIPIHSKTKILNPILACLSGGRNKMVAAKAYDFYNAELQSTGLQINVPETIWDVSKNEIPIWVKKMGGQAVVKVPYSNAGQGVFTIINPQELENFMARDFEYDRFIIQSLIGNYTWSSKGSKGKLFHVGTIPSKKGLTYVNDLRMMVHTTESGIVPLCVYSRRAPKPLLNEITDADDSWGMLGTNLSVKLDDGDWGSDTTRLLLMDRRDFNKLGIGLDDLIEAYIQTVLSTIAIDNMAKTFINSKGKFRTKLFASLNDDKSLIKEIKINF